MAHRVPMECRGGFDSGFLTTFQMTPSSMPMYSWASTSRRPAIALHSTRGSRTNLFWHTLGGLSKHKQVVEDRIARTHVGSEISELRHLCHIPVRRGRGRQHVAKPKRVITQRGSPRLRQRHAASTRSARVPSTWATRTKHSRGCHHSPVEPATRHHLPSTSPACSCSASRRASCRCGLARLERTTADGPG